MAEFIAGKTIETAENVIEVTSTPDKPLPIGVHRFQLVVKDDAGNLSQPALIEVVVRDSQVPTAVIDFADLRGTPQRAPDRPKDLPARARPTWRPASSSPTSGPCWPPISRGRRRVPSRRPRRRRSARAEGHGRVRRR